MVVEGGAAHRHRRRKQPACAEDRAARRLNRSSSVQCTRLEASASARGLYQSSSFLVGFFRGFGLTVDFGLIS